MWIHWQFQFYSSFPLEVRIFARMARMFMDLPEVKNSAFWCLLHYKGKGKCMEAIREHKHFGEWWWPKPLGLWEPHLGGSSQMMMVFSSTTTIIKRTVYLATFTLFLTTKISELSKNFLSLFWEIVRSMWL